MQETQSSKRTVARLRAQCITMVVELSLDNRLARRTYDEAVEWGPSSFIDYTEYGWPNANEGYVS